ncbi:MAG: glycosyltransferase [Synergistaceae bacterium]|nr:glycosyltransferase [Synergistaceae bacterium]
MARIIGTFGYNVDAAMFSDTDALRKITQKYDLIIDIRAREPGFWAKNMNDGCKLVVYSTGSSHKFAREGENRRLSDLEQRRGVKLQPRRTASLILENELQLRNADAFWHIGNSYNVHTYDYIGKLPPTSLIKNTGYNFGWVRTDIVRDKHNFLFFASAGQVHKGLDLLLEIFGREGFGLNLYICSSFMNEEDFCEEYSHELFERPNIFPVGFVDINGQEFREITEKCAFVIMPSCSEGCAGSILTAMSAGLIPIVSRVCGIDGEGQIILPDCSLETIERYINEYSSKPDEWIRERSMQCLNDARTIYSFGSFTQSVHDAMASLTAN